MKDLAMRSLGCAPLLVLSLAAPALGAWQDIRATDFTLAQTQKIPDFHSLFDACILGQLFPARSTELAAYGKHVGDLRVIVGAHHPEDDFQTQLGELKSSLPPTP